jgi:hypothetical protein
MNALESKDSLYDTLRILTNKTPPVNFHDPEVLAPSNLLTAQDDLLALPPTNKTDRLAKSIPDAVLVKAHFCPGSTSDLLT